LKSVAVILTVLAAILGLSLASVHREQERLVEEFTTATRHQAHASTDELSTRLEALDQDTRMLTDLVEGSDAAGAADAVTERRVWESAFRALAVVVPQYRAIALVGPAGDFQVLASDPSETPDAVAALQPPAQRLAREVSSRHVKALGQTARYGARSFLLYGTPVRGGRAIVVASDAAIFLGGVAWSELPAARLFVTDPAGVIWAGCETSRHCRETTAGAVQDSLEIETPPVWTGTRGARVLRRDRIPAVQVSERLERPTGSWVVTWVASTRPIIERERMMVARVIWTAMAAAFAVAVGGAVALRHQRKAVELGERLRYAQELAGARETSQAIVENAPLGVLGVAHDGRVVLANSFLTERLGPIRIGAPIADAFPDAGAAWARALAGLLLAEAPAERDLATGGADDPPAAPEALGGIQPVRSGAHQFHVRVVPVRNAALGVRTFALFEDQSVLRSLENQLVRAEKLMTVGVLSAGIAHEIGSPLAVIRGRAEQVLRALGAEAPRADDLRVIIRHIDNISSTIRQILDFSRRQPTNRQAVSLAAVLERARGLLQWKTEARGLALDVALDDGLPPLAADPDQLQQVLVNLLLNAADASTAGGRLLVTARVTREGRVHIEVVDQGCGIAPEHMNTVFDPFFTTKKRGEGTGLGLPIAASIVRNHGGEINLASTPGKGTTATIVWPSAAPGSGVGAAVADGERRPAAGAGPGPGGAPGRAEHA
jgi:signal transduction histidine kinase